MFEAVSKEDQLLDEVDAHHRVVSKGDDKFECASLSGDQHEFMVGIMKLGDFCRAKWFENKLVRWLLCAAMWKFS